MAGRIPKAFINDLLARIDIIDIIDSRLPLKRAGTNYIACCPFHAEKSPSFTVSPSKQFYHCFGCGSHGSAISFLMEYDHLEYVEAIESLAAQLGVNVPHENTGHNSKAPETPPHLYQYLIQAANYYQTELARSTQAQEYLQKRGLSAAIIQRFSMGYAPAGWQNVSNQFEIALHPMLETLGLVVKNKQGRYHDRFRERIIFPIRDQRGRVLGFGGRIITPNPSPEQPKYLNSPETPLFHKGNILYGLYEALQAHRELKRVLIVEGYMDVIALAQFGISYAVAAMGTAATRQHLERVFRHTSVIVFCFDGDNAGKNAAKRALETVLPLMEEGRQVKFMFLPEAHDPDSLIRAEGLENFQVRIDSAEGVGEYCFRLVQSDIDMSSMDGRAKFAKLAFDLINTIPAGTFKDIMHAELSKRTGIHQENLGHLTKHSAVPGESQSRRGKKSITTSKEGRPSAMRLVIALLLQHPSLIKLLSDEELHLPETLPGTNILHPLLQILQENPAQTTANLVEWWRDSPEYTHVSKLAMLPLSIPEGGISIEFKGALQQLIKAVKEEEINRLMQKTKFEGLSLEEKQLLQKLIRDKD
ncbi:MAG: DNA primase [Legionellales bacterium]|nr:DNA primase [Legionellales bacterium]